MRLEHLAICALFAFALPLFGQHPVWINGQFPVRSEATLSPPVVGKPIHVCAKAVHVSGFVPHATVRVLANGVDVGSAVSFFGFEDIQLTRELNLGEHITATQEVNGTTSVPSNDAVTVTDYPALSKPIVSSDIFVCGRVVPVDNLEPSAVVEVWQGGTKIGEANSTQAHIAVVVVALVAGQAVTARQVACPGRSSSRIVGPTSDPMNVQPAPNPMPKPLLNNWYPGNDAVTLHNLRPGAEIRVTSGSTPIGGGLATSRANWFRVSPLLTGSSDPRVTQKLCVAGEPSDRVPPSTRLPAPEIVRPVCRGDKYVRVDGTVLNASVVLMRGGTIIGYGGAVPGRLTLAVGPGVSLTDGDDIRAIQYIGTIISPASNAVVECAAENVITQHNDNARSGQYLAETKLNPTNVHDGSFGLLYTRSVDGEILAQPLYLRNVPTSSGTKNLFFIATSTNHLYAFDANDRSAGAAPVWDTDPSPLETTGPAAICSETRPARVGITSTPVIDPGTRRMYVVARSADGHHFLSVIDLTNGHRLQRAEISGSDRGTDFHPACHRQRPGLLLQKGVLYIAFGTFSCDSGCAAGDPYHGWVFAYRASNLQRLGAFCTTAGGAAAGVWQSGNGLVGDAEDRSEFGSVFFETGNEQGGAQPLGDSFVKLQLRPRNGETAFGVAGHFTPSNSVRLMNGDTDLGSGGPMLLPNHRLIGGGKEGKYYVLRTPDMTEVSEFQAFFNTWHLPPTAPNDPANLCPRTNIWADLPDHCYMNPVFYQDSEHWGPNIHAGPVYWSFDGSYGLVYQLPEKDVIKAFRYDIGAGTVNPVPVLTGTLKQPVDGMPGGFCSISAKKRENGIVWVSVPLGNGQANNVPGRLVALDARSLAELWRDTDNVTFSKFCAPTIADGKVIRATWWGLVYVYGLPVGRRSPFGPNPAAIAPIRYKDAPLGPEPEPYCYTPAEKYKVLGGERSLGKAERQTQLADGVTISEYSINVESAGLIASVPPLPLDQRTACDRPDFESKRVAVPAAIIASPRTCAHILEGDLLETWRRLGGPQSKFGLPVSDSSITADGMGRQVMLEHGTLVWRPDKGVTEEKKGPRAEPLRAQPLPLAPARPHG